MAESPSWLCPHQPCSSDASGGISLLSLDCGASPPLNPGTSLQVLSHRGITLLASLLLSPSLGP